MEIRAGELRSPRSEKKASASASARRETKRRSRLASASSSGRSRSRSRSASPRRSHKRRSHRSSRRSRRSRSHSRDRSRSRQRDHRSSRHRDRERDRSRDRHSSRKRSRRERSRSIEERDYDTSERYRKHHRAEQRGRGHDEKQGSSGRPESMKASEATDTEKPTKQVDHDDSSMKKPVISAGDVAAAAVSEPVENDEATTSQESMVSTIGRSTSQPCAHLPTETLKATQDKSSDSSSVEQSKEQPPALSVRPIAPKVDVNAIKNNILKALADARSTIAVIKKTEKPTATPTETPTDKTPVEATENVVQEESAHQVAPRKDDPAEPTPAPTNEVAAADEDEFDMFSAAELHQAGVPLSLIAAAAATATAAASGALQSTYDDPEGYYNPTIGEILNGKYRVLGSVGKGVFSTVLRCQRLGEGSAGVGDNIVAIKLIRNNEVMREASQTEIKILTELAERDPRDKKHCVRLLERFEHRNHVALVFESMQMNVREAMKKFGGKGGISIQAVRVFCKHLLIALSHLEACGIVHADIKPDNVLLDEKQTMIKLCDFGSAFKMNQDKHDPTPYLVSRFYRAPEIVLGLAYDKAVDMWSVGCCLYEMFTGKVMFPGATNNEMLKLFMELKGKVPNKIIKKHRQAYIDQFQMEPHFTEDNKFRSQELDRVTGKPVLHLMDAIKTKFDLGSALMSAKSSTDDRKLVMDLRNLLERMFTLDPSKRITPKEALAHPFVKGSA